MFASPVSSRVVSFARIRGFPCVSKPRQEQTLSYDFDQVLVRPFFILNVVIVTSSKAVDANFNGLEILCNVFIFILKHKRIAAKTRSTEQSI